jgi:hypothetical protein
LANRVLELNAEENEPRQYLGSSVEYVAAVGHEAPGTHS